MRFFALLLFVSILATDGNAQCDTWNGNPRQEDAENAHVVYRQYVKNKDYASALEQWQIAYEIAPAADGRRDSHFKDGIAIYRDMLTKATDDAKKQEYKDKMIELYDAGAECIASKGIVYKSCTDDECVQEKLGQWLGEKAVDMYYYIQTPRSESLEVFKEALRLAGTASKYTVLKPCADITVYLYQNDKITDQEARDYIKVLTDIADYNIANSPSYAQYYEYEKALMMQEVNKIDEMIYDCEYFVNKLTPVYESNPQDIDNLRYIIATLKKQGCTEAEPFLMKVEEQYGQYAAAYNDSLQAEFEANNPSIVAKKCYDAGDYACAIAKYEEAIAKEENPEQQAQYYFAMASIQYRKMDQYSTARSNARKAADLNGGWGRPYMLIGDMYAQSSRTCGNDAYSRGLAVIAAIDKWAYAKSVDSSVAEEANRNIAKFSQYLPPQDDAFMMGKKEGQTEKVGCWIAENVKLRFN